MRHRRSLERFHTVALASYLLPSPPQMDLSVADVSGLQPNPTLSEIHEAMLWMVCFFTKRSIEERLASRFRAATVRFNGHKHGVNTCQLGRVVDSQHPTTVGLAIHVEYPQIQRLSPSCRCPHAWKVSAFFNSCLVIQVEGVNNERLALSVKDAAKRLAGEAAAINIVYIRNVEPSVRPSTRECPDRNLGTARRS